MWRSIFHNLLVWRVWLSPFRLSSYIDDNRRHYLLNSNTLWRCFCFNACFSNSNYHLFWLLWQIGYANWLADKKCRNPVIFRAIICPIKIKFVPLRPKILIIYVRVQAVCFYGAFALEMSNKTSAGVQILRNGSANALRCETATGAMYDWPGRCG